MLLGDYRLNIYSQNGEDGITFEIFNRLGIEKGVCVEFGAWDGKYLSNTFALIEQKNWVGVLIEGDLKKYDDLLVTSSQFSNVIPVCAYVDKNYEDVNSLDRILNRIATIPKDFDLLSIDIDSYDLLVWESLKDYKPKVVIIETNDQHGPEADFRYSPTPVDVDNPGSSFAAIQKTAITLDYTLVCHTGNSFYVRNDLVEKIGLPQSVIDDPKLLFRA
jgi:hypothetical protein